MRGVRFSLILFVIAIVFAFQPGSAWGVDIIFYVEHTRLKAPYIDYWDKKVPVIPINVFCYDPWKKEYKDCEYELQELEAKERDPGVSDPAGHLHEDGRPLGELVWKSGGIQSSDTVGTTNFGVVKYEYRIPQVSGEIEFFGLIHSADARYATLHNAHITIKYLGPLEELPPSGDGSYSLTGSYGSPGVTSKHSQNHWAAPGTIKAIQDFAGDYFDATTGVSIEINDISLPWGGKFDVFNNWQGDHKLHRVGTSVDISPNGVKEKLLTQKAQDYGCKRDYKSDGIHFECPLKVRRNHE